MLASPIPRERLLHVAKKMPTAPRVMAEIGQMLLDVNANVEGVAGLLKRDAALTARLIRISNSAFYNAGTPFGSIEEALARVGFTEVYRMAGLAALAQVSDQSLPLYGISNAQFRENSLLTALVMEQLAGFARVDRRAAYTAGLLRSTGKIALDQLTRDPVYSGGRGLRGPGPLAERETGFIGLSNCEAAAIILEEWRFPPPIVGAIRDHYAPEASSPELVSLLNLAAGAAEHAGHGLYAETDYWTVPPERFEAAGVTPAQLEESALAALAQLSAVGAMLG